MYVSCCMYSKSVASKLHGVEVDIKVIKRKGDPLYDNESLANVETSTPANESSATASACPQHHQQQLAEQQMLDGASEKCKENRDDNKLLTNSINNANILRNSNMNGSNSISNSQGNLSSMVYGIGGCIL